MFQAFIIRHGSLGSICFPRAIMLDSMSVGTSRGNKGARCRVNPPVPAPSSRAVLIGSG